MPEQNIRFDGDVSGANFQFVTDGTGGMKVNGVEAQDGTYQVGDSTVTVKTNSGSGNTNKRK